MKMEFRKHVATDKDIIPNFFAAWEKEVPALELPAFFGGGLMILLEKEHIDSSPDSPLKIQLDLSSDVEKIIQTQQFKAGFEEWAWIHLKDYSHVWPDEWERMGLDKITQSEVGNHYKIHSINIPWFIRSPEHLYFYMILDCDWMIDLESVCVFAVSASSLNC